MMRTRKTFAVLFVVAALLCIAAAAYAGDSATQTVTFQVQEINEITVSGNPGPLVVNAATAGGAPVAATDSSTTYSVTTNGTGKKITAGINEAMPEHTALTVALASIKGTSAGPIDISNATTGAEVSVVTGLSKCTDSAQAITYTFSAAAEAGTVSGTKTVTFTIADAS